MSFYREITRPSAKNHQCEACRCGIAAGEQSLFCIGSRGDQPWHARYHLDCRAVEIEKNKEAGLTGEDWTALWIWVEAQGPSILRDAPEAVRKRFEIVPHLSVVYPAPDAAAMIIAGELREIRQINGEKTHTDGEDLEDGGRIARALRAGGFQL